MLKHSTWSTVRVRGVLTLAAALLLVLVASGMPTQARGGAGTGAPGDPEKAMGARLFDQCIRWVGRGSPGVDRARDFYVKLDAELDLDQTRHRGPMRIWWTGNDKYRLEMTTGGKTTAKILNVDRTKQPPLAQMWIVQHTGGVRRVHGTREGMTAIPQLQDDSNRMGDLAQFITLHELKGANVTFKFQGLKTGNGTYAGQWAKVTRSMPGSTNIHFWMAYDRDAAGNIVAKWPGIVRVDGSAKDRYPTEDYILKNWRDSPAGRPRGFRYPQFIEAYQFMPGTGQQPDRFLRATVEDIKINAGIDPSRFLPPRTR